MCKHVSVNFAMRSKSLQTRICVAFLHVQACVQWVGLTEQTASDKHHTCVAFLQYV